MRFERGKAVGKLKDVGAVNRRGTIVSFKPDAQIFGKDTHFSPRALYRMAQVEGLSLPRRRNPLEMRSRAHQGRHAGRGHAEIPRRPARLPAQRGRRQHATVTPREFSGRTENRDGKGAVEWAVTWTPQIDPFVHSYCNTIPTPQGGTHEQGLRNALTQGAARHGERTNNRKTALITPDDVMAAACAVLSVFIREPEFQGQTKDKLSTPDAQRLVENVVRDHFDHWLAESPQEADRLLDFVVDQAEDRLKRRQEKETQRKSATRKLRLPGKLADCTRDAAARHRDIPGRGRLRRRLGQAGARPRDAGGAAAARQDPQRRERRRGQARSRTRNSPIWCRRWAAARARSIATRTCATSASSS